MTTQSTSINPPTILDDIKRRSGWGLFMGIVTSAVGIILMVYPFATATITTVFLGSTLLLVGAAELALGFASQTPRGFFGQLVLAALYAFTGIVLLAYPFQGVESLTLFAGAMLVVRGVLALVVAFRVKPLDGWAWFLADAIGSLAAGGYILAKFPSSSTWAVGTLIGASVLVTGVARTGFAARIRQGTRDLQRSVQRSQ